MENIVSLKDAINELRENNAEELGGIKKSSEKTSDGITVLNNNLKSQFLYQKRQNLDKKEEKREAARKVTRATDSKSTVPKFDDDSKFGDLFIFGGGILGKIFGVLTVIPIAIKEFFIGLGQGLKGIFKTIDTLSGKRLSALSKTISGGLSNLFKPITNFFTTIRNIFDAIGDAFRKAGTGQIVRNNQALGKLLKPITDFFASLKRFFSMMNTMLVKPFQAFFAGVARVLSPITDLFKGVGGLIPTRFIKEFTENTGKFSGAISRIGNLFRLIGRIFVPIVIFFDGLFGFFRGFSEQTGFINKLIGGIVGIVKGIVGGFASFFDIIKDIFGWIFRLVGLDFIADLLDKFSFRGITDFIFDGLTKAFILVKDFFLNPIDTIIGLVKSLEDIPVLGTIFKVIGTLLDVIKSIGSAIFNFLSFPIKVLMSIGSFIGKIIEKIKGGSSIKEALGSAIDVMKQKLNDIFLSILPEPDSFLGKFVPAFVYEKLGVTKGEPRVKGDETSEEDVRDTQTREERLRGLATEMGIDQDEIDAKMVGNVPVEINQQEVPVKQYTEKEIKSILAADALAKALGKEGLPEEKVQELLDQEDPYRDIRPGPNAIRYVRDADGNLTEVDIPEEERRQPSVVRIFPDDGPMITQVSDPEQDSLKEKILGSGPSIMSSIAEKYFGTLDAVKNGFAKGLEFVGADDLAEKLRGFSVKEKMMEVFNIIGDTISSAFEGIGDIGADILSGIKRLIRGALPDQDSVVGKLIPDFVWEWLGEEKPQSSQTETGGESRQDTTNRIADQTSVPERTRPERPEMSQRSLARTILDSSQKEKQATSNAAIAVSQVDTSQRVVNNVNNNQAAMINKNAPAVDNLDRSWVSKDW